MPMYSESAEQSLSELPYNTIDDEDLRNQLTDTTAKIAEERTPGDLTMDGMNEVNIGTQGDERLIMIRESLDKEEREALIALLKDYKDVFAYDYDEMPGLDKNLVVHNIGVSPEFNPVKQRSREFPRATALTIKEEVERLLKAKFIKPIQQPTWLDNIVPVVKKNGKVR